MVAAWKIAHLHRLDLEVVGNENVIEPVERKRHPTNGPGRIQPGTTFVIGISPAAVQDLSEWLVMASICPPPQHPAGDSC